MILIQTFSFSINTEGTFSEKYPDLRGGFYTQPFTVNNNNYSFKIFPNFFMENIEISIIDAYDNPIINNIPFNNTPNINYLIGDINFNNYSLIYNFNKNQFELYNI